MLASRFLGAPRAIILPPHHYPQAPESPALPLTSIFRGCRSNDYLQLLRHHNSCPIGIEFAKFRKTNYRLLSLSNSYAALAAAYEDDKVEKKPGYIQSFPLIKSIKVMQEQVLNKLVSFGKWLLLIAAVQYTVSEVAYALLHGPELLVPLGLLAGVVFAGVAGEAVQEFYGNNKYRPVPYILLLLFFASMKLMGPALPKWGLIFLPHFANGGLWQTYIWRKQQQSESDVQECDVVSAL